MKTKKFNPSVVLPYLLYLAAVYVFNYPQGDHVNKATGFMSFMEIAYWCILPFIVLCYFLIPNAFEKLTIAAKEKSIKNFEADKKDKLRNVRQLLDICFTLFVGFVLCDISFFIVLALLWVFSKGIVSQAESAMYEYHYNKENKNENS